MDRAYGSAENEKAIRNPVGTGHFVATVFYLLR